MSYASTHARAPNRRLNSNISVNGGDGRTHSLAGRPRKRSIDGNEAYLYALRVAYLAHLLQPRQKRTRHIPKPSISRSHTSTSINDLMKDFQGTRDSKSTKYPHAFLKVLEKRLQGILTGQESRPEYNEQGMKRSCAIFLNQLSDPSFKKQMEESKRAEDLVLMFYSKTVTELSRGKPPHDDGVKRLVDRHLALFIRLMSLILKEKGWADERKDLALRLSSLETKLLKHEADLAGSPSDSTANGTTTIEEELPVSHDVKDMQLVQVVKRIFGLRDSMIQSDLDKHKSEWTEAAAVKDLKTYQAYLNFPTRRTLSAIDFDTDEAYQDWKKAEAPEISQMVISIVQLNPQLQKFSTGNTATPQFNPQRASVINDGTYTELAKVLSPPSTEDGGYDLAMGLPDLSGLQLDETLSPTEDNEHVYTFIPADARGYFRYILNVALTYDIGDALQRPDGASDPQASQHILSKQSTDLMNELASRWRIPKFSRLVLYLDCIKEKFVEQMINLDQLDAAFQFVKEPEQADPKNKRTSLIMASVLGDRFKWTLTDWSLMQQILQGLNDALLRELYGAMMTCLDNKQSPLLGSILTLLDQHIRTDPSFSQTADDESHFQQQVREGLQGRARELYSEFVEKEIPGEQDTWEFYHIIQLGKKVLAQAEKIQKRFRRNPEIMGVSPLTILMDATLPAYAEDSKAMIDSVIQTTKERDLEVPIQDGFDLYKELSNFRRVFNDALPDKRFPYSIEEPLQEFVWKWIKAMDDQIRQWVEQAIQQDNFKVRTEGADRPPNEDERHSTSVTDVFRSFNQVIQQVTELEWGDPLTYAKFMTALSKSIGSGVSRYCEVLEVMFTKEMDRLTPEQEAALTQTRQEKLMKYAKDTWNQDTKVEPFQFYAESFVKLNDISYAISQWDKLEQDINVDGCADAIKRYSPPSVRQPRKISNYVFTIKIVEGEGLKACDVNGLSDPYVVLTDEYQKRLFKSKTVYRNLNPRWDESVDITTQGPLNLIATIWDWDAVGDHDYVGRTSLKLDPSHFGDFLPREYWLDLDTQGRVLVRVSMEGERDDIQFYFGKAFRTLQRTQRDMTRKITDKLSAYINYCLSRRTLKALTSKGISVAAISNYIYRSRASVQPQQNGPTETEIRSALTPLFTYFDDNFFIMNQTLTSDAMVAVMTRLWKEVLVTMESLLVPPLSDKPSQQKPLSQQELDIVFKWLQSLFDFFHAVDPETQEANGVPLNVLKSPKYHEIQTLNFFYSETTENLIRTSERMASATAASQQAQRSRLSAPPAIGGGGLLSIGSAQPATRRAKSIMLARNLGTMRKAKEEKWKQAQAEPSDDMILRILRMRPEAAGYLRDRSRQKERLAAAAAAEMIVRQSLAAGGGRMTGPSVIRR